MFSTNSIFSRNVANTNTFLTNADARNRILISMYAKLSVYVRTIRMLLDQYSKGHFYEVANVLTNVVYNRMSVQINNLAADANKYSDYENIRMGTVSALQGLYQSILQYANLVDVEIKLDKAKECEEILNDPVKLEEYIKMLHGRRTLFKESKVQTIKATLKPEYAEYIRSYGFPEGGVFDMDKLALVCKRLNIPLV